MIFGVVDGRNGVMPLMFQEKILRAWRPVFVWAGRMDVGAVEASAQGVCSADDRFRRFNGGGLTSRDDVEDIESNLLRVGAAASCIDRRLGGNCRSL